MVAGRKARPTPRDQSASGGPLSDFTLGGLLVALTLLFYLPAVFCGFIWDDQDYVVDNATLRSPSGLWKIWSEPRSLPQYYPLVHTTYWLEYRLWQLNPLGYHVTNILL